MQNNMNNTLPLGFLFEIQKNPNALANYSKLDELKKIEITNYIQNSSTGLEAKEKINTSIKNLENNTLDFLN